MNTNVRFRAWTLLCLLLVLPQSALAITYGEAWQACRAVMAASPPQCTGLGCGSPPLQYTYKCEENTVEVTLKRMITPPGTSWGNLQSWRWSGGKTCPSGQTMNPSGGCSCTNGYAFDPENPSQCLDADKCTARNSGLSPGETVRNFASACIAGCQLKVTTPTVGVDGLYSGHYEYSGASCAAQDPPKLPDEPDKRPPQECTPAGAGQTFCLKPNGDHCYGTSAGRQVCWKPGETGDKNDDDTRQKRDAGNEPRPPDLNLPNGDTLEPKGGPNVKTTQVTDAQGNVRTIVTVTQNYGTTNGTNAGGGSANNGEPSDGTGAPDGEGDDPTATGGESCTAPPVMQGDAVAAMGALQAWRIRCGTTLADKNADGVPDYLNTADLDMSHGESAVDGKSAWDETPADGAELDTGGFGLGDSCPAPPTFYGKTIDTSAMCDLAGIIAALVYAISLAHAAYIFGGNK